MVFIAFIIDLAFTVSLGAFVAMHWRMVSSNQTTIEMYEKVRVRARRAARQHLVVASVRTMRLRERAAQRRRPKIAGDGLCGFQAPMHPWPYDRGTAGNFKEVFGRCGDLGLPPY